jgi:hypothetical protein
VLTAGGCQPILSRFTEATVIVGQLFDGTTQRGPASPAKTALLFDDGRLTVAGRRIDLRIAAQFAYATTVFIHRT